MIRPLILSEAIKFAGLSAPELMLSPELNFCNESLTRSIVLPAWRSELSEEILCLMRMA